MNRQIDLYIFLKIDRQQQCGCNFSWNYTSMQINVNINVNARMIVDVSSDTSIQCYGQFELQ